MTINTQNISNVNSTVDTEQQINNTVIEKVLENMSGQMNQISTMDEISSMTSSTSVNSIRSNTRKMTAALSLQAEIKTSAKATTRSNTNMMTAAPPPPAAEAPPPAAAPPPPAPASSSTSGNTNEYLIPAPPLPPSDGPNYTDLSDPDINNWILTDQDVQIETALTNYYAYLAGPGMTDPTGMMNLMNFIYYLSVTDGADGQPLMDPEITDFLLDNGDLIGTDNGTTIDGGIELWTRQMSDYAYLNGYTDTNGVYYPPGEDARTAWINDETAAWKQVNPPNVFSEEVLRCLADPDITNDPNLWTADNGDIMYTYDGIDYDWTNPSSSGPFNDQDIIMYLVNAQSTVTYDENGDIESVELNSFYANLNNNVLAMEADYRTTTLDTLLEEFEDPIWAVLIFFAMCMDDQFQAEMSGHARESDDVTEWDEYSTALNQSITDFETGDGTTEDTENFVYALYGGKVYADTHPSVNGLDSSFTTDVYDPIINIQNDQGQTIGELVQENQDGTLSDQELTDQLNAIFDSSPPTDGSAAVPNNNAQIAVNASNTFSSEVTGESKNFVTIQAEDASTEAALNKFFGSINQMHSQIGNALVNNQIPT